MDLALGGPGPPGVTSLEAIKSRGSTSTAGGPWNGKKKVTKCSGKRSIRTTKNVQVSIDMCHVCAATFSKALLHAIACFSSAVEHAMQHRSSGSLCHDFYA
eukprot:1159497-Pelagomonas_calceolata.AAC.4